MSHSLTDSLVAGGVAAAATAVLVSSRGRVNVFGMDVNAPLGVGAVVAGSDVIASYLEPTVLGALGLEAPTTQMLAVPVTCGLATYGLMRYGVSDRASFATNFALGAVSSWSAPMLKNSLLPGY